MLFLLQIITYIFFEIRISQLEDEFGHRSKTLYRRTERTRIAAIVAVILITILRLVLMYIELNH